MKAFKSAAAIYCLVLLVIGPDTRAAVAAGADPVMQQVEQARITHDQVRTKARDELMLAFTTRIKSLAAAGDDAGLRALLAQKEAFTTTGALPTSPLIKDAVGRYNHAMSQANLDLLDAMDGAIDQYTKAGNFSASLALRTQRRLVAEGRDEPPAPGLPDDSNPASGLARAKSEYTQTLDEARKSLVGSIGAREDSATAAGNLEEVKRLDQLKSAVDAGSDVPENIQDPAVLAARSRYPQAVRAANARLAVAYRAAIRDLTRARRLDEAEAKQAEMKAIGLCGGGADATPGAAGAVPAAVAPSVDYTYKLAEVLPPPLVGGGTYAVERQGGIRPADHSYIKTRSGVYLTKNFTFDVTFEQAANGARTYVGIGEARPSGGSAGEPEDSVDLRISPANSDRGSVALNKESWGYGGQGIGNLSEPGEYVARIEKRGDAVTFSIGTMKDGVFTADVSRTVPDIKEYAPFLNEKNAHLFFGGAMVFKQYHLRTGDADDSTTGSDRPVRLPAATAVSAAGPTTPAPAAATAPAVESGRRWMISPGTWSRRWTIKGADLEHDTRVQTYTVFDAGARVKAYSWNLPFVPEASGSLSIEGSHFFQSFTKTADGISVHEWATRADYVAGKDPLRSGVFDPIILDAPPPGVGAVTPSAAASVPAAPAAPAEKPKVIVSCDQPIHLADLEVNEIWLYNSKPARRIEHLAPALNGFKFTPIPQQRNMSYRISTSGSAWIYAFGFGKNSTLTAAQAFGADAGKWEAADADIQGYAIGRVWKRQIRPGEIISLQAYEVSIAAENLEVSR